MHAGAVVVPGRARGLRARGPVGRACSGWHRHRRGADVPAEPGGADGRAQGRVSPHGGFRGAGRGWRRGRRHRPASRRGSVSALGIAGSMASGIIEYLAEGTWTKRMHAGWAAQSGIRAALMARGGFKGPRTVLEGTHGFYKAFAPSVAPDFGPLLSDLGRRWVTEDLAFKPYACGTMTQPFIDCALRAGGRRRVRRVHRRDRVRRGGGHRAPFVGAAGLQAAAAHAVCGEVQHPVLHGRRLLRRPRRLRAVHRSAHRRCGGARRWRPRFATGINPADEYPRNFSGHLRATLRDGSTREYRQPHMRGGAGSR